MAESKPEIQLNFKRQHFEEIYFRNGQANIFWGQNVKGHFSILLVFAVAFICSLIVALIQNDLWGLPAVLFFIFLLSVFRYRRQILPILKWKKQVNKYLNGLSKIKNHKLILTHQSIVIIQDNEETIIKWSAITKAQINDGFINLTSTENLLLPQKSMTLSEYEYVKRFISDRLKTDADYSDPLRNHT